MKISKEEQDAVRQVIELGARFGYGNMICHLQAAWANSLIAEYGLDRLAAEEAATRDGGYLLALHKDLVERGEWDETGKKYRKA